MALNSEVPIYKANYDRLLEMLHLNGRSHIHVKTNSEINKSLILLPLNSNLTSKTL